VEPERENHWRALALTALVLGTMFASCQRSMSQASTLRPASEIQSLFCFYVLVEEHGEPQLVSIRDAMRSSPLVSLEPGQTPITTTEGLQRAAVALAPLRHSYSVTPTLSDGTILLKFEKDDIFWSQYSVDAGRIVPLRAASFARRDLAAASVRAFVLGLLVLTLSLIALPTLRSLAHRASSNVRA
jgi:hypothetical protein